MRINNNMMAMNTHRQLGIATQGGAKSMEKLSSGFRINRAGDDAAGLAISEKMRGQIRGLNQASTNAQDGISLIQTAEGALNETHAILQRMRELAVQSSTDTNTDSDRAELQKEVDQLAVEITRIAETTQFNTMELLDGSFEDKKFHIGANSTQNAGLEISNMDAKALGVTRGFVAEVAGPVEDVEEVKSSVQFGDIKFTAKAEGVKGDDIEITSADGSGNNIATSVAVTSGNKIAITLGTDASGNVTATVEDIMAAIEANADASALVKGEITKYDYESAGKLKPQTEITTAAKTANGVDPKKGVKVDAGEAANDKLGINISNQKSADSAITTINDALETVSSERSKLGAMQNRLEHTIKNLDTSAENLQQSESRIRDVDMAKEMMEQTKNNILQQASQAMLAQANAHPQGVLQLLG